LTLRASGGMTHNSLLLARAVRSRRGKTRGHRAARSRVSYAASPGRSSSGRTRARGIEHVRWLRSPGSNGWGGLAIHRARDNPRRRMPARHAARIDPVANLRHEIGARVPLLQMAAGGSILVQQPWFHEPRAAHIRRKQLGFSVVLDLLAVHSISTPVACAPSSDRFTDASELRPAVITAFEDVQYGTGRYKSRHAVDQEIRG
jgi:hypothetical protein